MSKKPVERYTAIRDAMENMADYHTRAETDFNRISRSIKELKTGMVEKALADFPDNGSAIRSRFAPFLKIEQDAARHLEGVNSQFDRYTGNGKADFAVFADSCSAWDCPPQPSTNWPGTSKRIFNSCTRAIQRSSRT